MPTVYRNTTVIQFGASANHLVSFGDFNKFLGARPNCFQGKTDFITLQNDVLNEMEDLEDPMDEKIPDSAAAV